MCTVLTATKHLIVAMLVRAACVSDILLLLVELEEHTCACMLPAMWRAHANTHYLGFVPVAPLQVKYPQHMLQNVPYGQHIVDPAPTGVNIGCGAPHGHHCSGGV